MLIPDWFGCCPCSNKALLFSAEKESDAIMLVCHENSSKKKIPLFLNQRRRKMQWSRALEYVWVDEAIFNGAVVPWGGTFT